MFSYPFEEQAYVLLFTVIGEIYQANAIQRVETKRIGLDTLRVFNDYSAW